MRLSKLLVKTERNAVVDIVRKSLIFEKVEDGFAEKKLEFYLPMADIEQREKVGIMEALKDSIERIIIDGATLNAGGENA